MGRLPSFPSDISAKDGCQLMTFELLIFGMFAFVAIAVLAVMVVAVGVPFGVSPKLAIPIAVYIFAVIFPGAMNLWIAATGNGGEDETERVAAGVRGVAMIVGWTTVIFVFGPRNAWSPYLPYLLALCVILFAWSVWRASRHQRMKLEDKGLIR
jgi:uncharacterized membrane protein